MTESILTLTLNPALDMTTTTELLAPRRKLRCSAPVHDAGGGGVNVSRAIKVLGGASTAFVALGGGNGQLYRDILMRTGIASEIVDIDGETRFSLTVMEHATGEHYRFVLPGPPLDDTTADRLIARVQAAVVGGHRWVIASGSLPPGLPVDTYARIARKTREAGGFFIIDSAGPALGAVLAERPQVVRLNHFEAQEFLGGGDPVDAARTLAERLIARREAEIAIITIGDEGAVVATETKRFLVHPPRVDVISSVGAGDSFVGAMTLGLARRWPLEQTVQFAVAAAAAAVMTPASELCRLEDTERLIAETRVEPLAEWADNGSA